MLLKENSNAHLSEEEYAELRGKVSEWDNFRGSRPIVFMAESPGPKASRANGNALYLGSDTRRNLDEALGDYAFLLEGAYRFNAAVAKVEGRANDRFYATDGIERVRIVFSYIERTIPHRQITAVLMGLESSHAVSRALGFSWSRRVPYFQELRESSFTFYKIPHFSPANPGRRDSAAKLRKLAETIANR